MLILLTPQAMTQPTETARAIVRVGSGCGKTVLASFIGADLVRDGIRVLRDGGIPQFPSPERAARVLESMAEYTEWRRKPPRVFRRFAVHRTRVEKVIRQHRRQGLVLIGEEDAKDILEAYGFVVPRGILARSVEEAISAAEKLGYPSVLKIASPDITHKSDVGGVRVGLEDADAVADAFELMTLRIKRKMPEARIEGATVQEMKSGGREVIVGMTRDPQFGPLIMFGLGGIYVEVLKDVTFELAPVTEEEALEMIRRTRTYPLLRGVRGEEGVDTETIAEAIQRVSQLAIDFPEIVELDINPLKVNPAGHEAIAVDARIRLAEA